MLTDVDTYCTSRTNRFDTNRYGITSLSWKQENLRIPSLQYTTWQLPAKNYGSLFFFFLEWQNRMFRKLQKVWKKCDRINVTSVERQNWTGLEHKFWNSGGSFLLLPIPSAFFVSASGIFMFLVISLRSMDPPDSNRKNLENGNRKIPNLQNTPVTILCHHVGQRTMMEHARNIPPDKQEENTFSTKSWHLV